MAPRPLARRLHLWLGLVLGGVFAVQGLTGSLLALLGDHAPPPVVAPPLEEALRAAASFGRVETIVFAEPLRITVRGPDGSRRLCGAVPTPCANTASETLLDLHARMMAGRPGGRVLGAAAVALLIGCLTGLILLPRSNPLKLMVAGRRGGGRRHLDLHRLLGLAMMPVLLTTAASGALLNYRDLLLPLAGAPAPATAVAASRAPGDADALVAALKARYPEARLVSLTFAADGTTLLRFGLPEEIHPTGRSYARFDHDGWTVRLAADAPAAHWLLDQLPYPLHAATPLGSVGRWLLIAAGLAPLLLLITALVWRRGSGRGAGSVKQS